MSIYNLLSGYSSYNFDYAVIPSWMGGGTTSDGAITNTNNKYVFTHYKSTNIQLAAGNYTVKVWGGAGGYAQGGGNGSAGGGGGGYVSHTFTLGATTTATVHCGTAGGSFFGDAQNGRAGYQGMGYHNGGAGGGLTNITLYEYTTAGVYTFTTPGTSGQTCTAEVTLIGGGGGAGGSDGTTPGGYGGSGQMIRGYVSLPAATSISVLVGGGGGGGGSGVSGSGGGGGATTGSGVFASKYNGGNGGNAGSSGTSGAGGGGGSASVLRNNASSTDLLVAAGGGGGGGGGNNSSQPNGRQGRNGSVFHSPTANTNGSVGSSSGGGDGGGGGGGGGGYLGGIGGTVDGPDYGGNGGWQGSNYIGTGTFSLQVQYPNGGVINGGSGGAGYARILIHPNVPAASYTRGGGAGGASSRFYIAGVVDMYAGGGGGGGADGSRTSSAATGGGKVGNNSAGGAAGSDGFYPETSTAGGAGVTPGGGGGGGSDEQFNAPEGQNGTGGLNSGPISLAGTDGGRNATGTANNTSDTEYLLAKQFITSCATGNGSDWSGFMSGGAVVIIKNS